jgi:hypothetical protein
MNERTQRNLTGYEKYLLLASRESSLTGGYQGYIGIQEVISVLELMSQKQETSYLYKDKLLHSSLTITEINTILECWEDGKYRSGLKKIKRVANQIGVRTI